MGILPSVTRPSSVFRVWAWVQGYISNNARGHHLLDHILVYIGHPRTYSVHVHANESLEGTCTQ